MIKRIWNDKFSRNVLTLMTGTVISQAIPIAISPILTRIYTPEDFGLFALFFSVTSILSIVISARYEMTIILPEDDKDAVNILFLSLVITTAVSIVTLILVLLFSDVFALWLHEPKIAGWLIFIPLSVFMIGIYQALSYWLNRKSRYTALSGTRITRSVGASLASLGLGFTSLKPGGLILGDTIGQSITSGYVAWDFWRNDRHLVHSITRANTLRLAKRYQHFPKFNMFSGLLEKGSGQVPMLLITSFWGLAVSGLFSLSMRVISVPGSVIARAIGDVFRQQANEEFLEKGNCRRSFRKMTILLSGLGIVPFSALFIFATPIFKFAFGSEWAVAGDYARIMTIMFFLQFIVSPLSNMFLIAEKQKIDLMIQAILFTFVCAAFLAGYNIFHNPVIAVILFTAVYSIKYCVEFYLSYRFSFGKKTV
ncbi:MAG: oligosaccharide flippase family protein [Bacteroidota bacterium]